MAETPSPSGPLADVLRLVAPHAAGFAGAVLALAFLDTLTIRGRIVAVAVGLASSIWFPPLILAVASVFIPAAAGVSQEVKSGLAFLTGLSAMGVLPPFLAWIKRVAGDPLSLLRVRVGPPPPSEGGVS